MKIRNKDHLIQVLKVASIIFVLYLIAYIIDFNVGCAIVRTIGIECMSCGMTRAWFALLSGNLDKAFYFHPLFIFPAIAIILFSLNHYILKSEKKSIKYTLYVMLVIYVIFYVVRMFYDIPGIYELDNHFDLFNLR